MLDLRAVAASLVALGALATAWGCGSHIPSVDIADIVASRTATWITTANSATGYTPYGGYGSACPHTGADVLFAAGGQHVILSALEGIVTRVDKCAVTGTNDSYVITIAVAMKGSVPVYLEYQFEPAAGKPCSSAAGSEEYFDSWIFVEEGDRVVQGQQISFFTAQGASAHVHLSLKADGAAICPEIFPASSIADTTLAGTLTGTCGGTAYAAGTLCHALTPGEDPNQVFE